MKKILFVLSLAFISLSASSQNFQLLGGASSDKSFVNWATFELYKPLEHGSLYYFTDFKLDKNGYFEAYTEISKYWNAGPISLTAQLNAGLNKDFQILPVYLGGVQKLWEVGNFVISFDALYRYQQELILDNEWAHGYQITMIFLQDLEKIQFSGYLDFWNSGYFVFEPQGWWKASNRIWLGLEWRASNYSLLENYTNYVMFGFKWNLE
ncbi:MAG TPA: DUF5020 family protein [Candidatus Glassbacteria bacterium]|nr:DUF5020 family protein [Candidatus Glassbacteria bacterium]